MITRKFMLSLGRVDVPTKPVLDRTTAYLCCECEAIGSDAKTCPRCGSTALVGCWRFIQHCEQSARLICIPRQTSDNFYRRQFQWTKSTATANRTS